MPHNLRRQRFAVSFVELLVVTGIIGGSMAIMIPALQHARAEARAQACAGNLKQVTQGILTFEALRGSLPPGGCLAPPVNCQQQGFGSDFGCFPINAANHAGAPNVSWTVLILPYIGEEVLYDEFDFNLTVFLQPNRPQERSPSILQCPSGLNGAPNYDGSGPMSPGNTSKSRYGKGNYAAYVSPQHVDHQLFFPAALGGFLPGSAKGQPLRAIHDGLSHTMAVTEVRKGMFRWDSRGAWSLPWPGCSLLAADWHHWLQPGESFSDLSAIRRFVPDPAFGEFYHRPNNQNVELGDTLFACRPPSALRVNMPCGSISSFMAAASRSLHATGVNASALDCSVRFISNDVDGLVYIHLVHTRDEFGLWTRPSGGTKGGPQSGPGWGNNINGELGGP